MSRAKPHLVKALLMAALNEMPAESSNKEVDDYASMYDLAYYNGV